MIGIVCFCLSHYRRIFMTNTTVNKTFVGHNVPWLGMSDYDSFYHEAELLMHIEQKKKHCHTGRENIVTLLNIDVASRSIITKRDGHSLTRHDKVDSYQLNRTMHNVTHFLKCAGITYCDFQLKNFAIAPNSKLYLFDMDMAYLTTKGKPTGMKCTEDENDATNHILVQRMNEIKSYY